MKLMGRDSIAIVPTAPVRLRNNDVEYAYRPDSDFYYLTGFNEPESVAVLVPGRPQGEYILSDFWIDSAQNDESCQVTYDASR